MNDRAHQRMTQEAVKKKFGSHKVLLMKRAQYPEQAEREYKRVTNAYMRLLNKRLKEYLPKMKALADAEKNGQRHDDIGSFLSALFNLFAHLAADLEADMDSFSLTKRLEAMANLTQKLSIRDWKRQVKATLGIDLMDDYYTGELFKDLMKQWIDDNVDLIKTIPKDSLGKMRETVFDGYRNGVSTTDIVKKIQSIYGMDRRHAQLIARDQIAKLNGQITRIQQEDAGVTEYIWSTSEDSRVRESHAALNNKRFKWSDPPVVDALTGRRCHPGEDYQCRCCALAVFDLDTVDLPIANTKGVEGG